MTNLQHLLTELENKQIELESKLKKAIELKTLLAQKHEQNLTSIQNQIEREVAKDFLDQNKINADLLQIDISKLKIEILDIENSLNEIFKI